MANVSSVTATWQGFSGAPGYSRFHFSELTTPAQAQTAVNAVRSFFGSLGSHLMTTWSVQVSSVVQNTDVASGDLVAEITAPTPPTPVAGTIANTNVYTGGSGYVIDWITGQFWNGRKVRGRTFIVPAVGVYSPDGTISTAAQTTAQNAATALIGTAGITLAIYARKFDDSKPPKQQAGAVFAVNGVLVPDRAAQLRTRRS
jgi:hypothetical protein